MPAAVPLESALGNGLRTPSQHLPRKLSQNVRTSIFFSDILPQDTVVLSKDIHTLLFPVDDGTADKFVVLNSPSSNKWTLFALLPRDHTANPQESAQHFQSLLPPESCLVSAHSRHAIASLSGIALVRPTVPPVLDQVLILCSPETYATLHDSSANIVDLLAPPSSFPKVLRQGEFCTAIGGLAKLCDPVDQGVVDPLHTKVTIVKDKSLRPLPTKLFAATADVDAGTDALPLLTANNGTTVPPASAGPSLLESPDLIDAEISKYLDFVNDWSTSDSAPTTQNGSTPSSANANGSASSASSLDSNTDTPLTFSRPIPVKALDQPVPSATIVPLPLPKDDPESRGFVKIEFLAEIGCFSGDVVLIKTNKVTRHITLFSYPEPNTAPSRTLYISPVLFHNIGSPSDIQIAKLSTEKIETGSSKKSSKETSYSHYLETAKEVTISRLASAVTTDRTLQVAFLSGLRTYFESCHRIIKNGDIIVIPIDTILAKTLEDIDDAGAIPVGRPNAVAWFKITALNMDDGEDESSSKDEDIECIINPSQTRMVQSGIVTGNAISTTLPWKQYLSLPSYPSYGLESSPKFEYAKKLQQYFLASISPLGASLQTTILVHSSKRGTGKTSVIHSVAEAMGIHVFEINGFSTIGDNDAKTFGILRARLERAAEISPCVVLIKHIDALAKKSEQDGKEGAGITSNIINLFNYMLSSKENFIITATAADADKLSDSIRALFNFEVDVGVPTEDERRDIFRYISRTQLPTQVSEQRFGSVKLPYTFSLRSDVSIDTLALQSAGLTPPDLLSIVQTSKQKALQRLSNIAKQGDSQLFDLILSSGGVIKITPEDIEDAIGEARRKYSDSIGAPRIPNVSWDDVGGLEGVKKEILDTIEMPLKYPELFSGGMKKRSGILFYGPPGTGKTLLAKAIATTFSLNFFSVKGPELLNMYIGESEANVRKVFQKARDARPCVVFFDELDSVAPKRGNQGDSGGVMDRIVSQLLAELDGMSGSGGEGVFVVGATNRPDLLDEALLRPGRFDKMLYLGVSDTHAKQQTILEALTRKFKLAGTVSLESVAAKCPFTYTGADFYALCSDAMLNAMTRTAGEVDEKYKRYNEEERVAHGLKPISIRWWFENVGTDTDIDVLVTDVDFDKSLRELIPSVSADELRHYMRVRESFQGGKKNAKGGIKGVENGVIAPEVLDGGSGKTIQQAIDEAARQTSSLRINGAGSSIISQASESSSGASFAGAEPSFASVSSSILSTASESEPVPAATTSEGSAVHGSNGSTANGSSSTANGGSAPRRKLNKGKGISRKH